jgi:hypothetical protein
VGTLVARNLGFVLIFLAIDQSLSRDFAATYGSVPNRPVSHASDREVPLSENLVRLSRLWDSRKGRSDEGVQSGWECCDASN